MEVSIYQIKDDDCEYQYMPYELAEEKISIKDYEKVYEYEAKAGTTIEDVYQKFQHDNTRNENEEDDCPDDFTGHSLSVSDIVVIDGVYNYCDDVGFTKINVGEK